MKNNYNFGVVKLHFKFNQRTISMPHKFKICFPSQNLILFQLDLCLEEGMRLIMKILYTCAMEKEAIEITKKLNMEKIEKNIYRNENETMLITGIGKQRTAINLTKYLCENEKPEQIINIGYAGSTNIEIGKWVNITRVHNYEWDILGEEKYNMSDVGNQQLVEIQANIPKVECYSAESFVTHTDIKETVAFDMELHSIAIICSIYKIPLISLKKISDNLSLDKYYESIQKEEVMELVSFLHYIPKKSILV